MTGGEFSSCDGETPVLVTGKIEDGEEEEEVMTKSIVKQPQESSESNINSTTTTTSESGELDRTPSKEKSKKHT